MGDAGLIGWLVDGAAIITQTNMLNASYGPYARALKRICAEEVFHAQHGEAIIMALAEGTDEQRAMVQDAVNRWWEALLMFFGPGDASTTGTSKQDTTIKYKIRTKTNEDLRQDFLQNIFHAFSRLASLCRTRRCISIRSGSCGFISSLIGIGSRTLLKIMGQNLRRGSASDAQLMILTNGCAKLSILQIKLFRWEGYLWVTKDSIRNLKFLVKEPIPRLCNINFPCWRQIGSLHSSWRRKIL